jgi:hypothetical protein
MSERISETLYELSDELQRIILTHVDPDTGVLDDDFEAELLKLEGDFQEKCIQTALYIKGLRTEGAAIIAMAQAIADQAVKEKARAEVLLRQAERLLAYLDSNMRAQELTGIDDPRATIKYRKGSQVVEVLAEEWVPEEFRLEPVEPPPSKKLLKQAMQIRDATELMDGEVIYAKLVRKPSTLKIA